MSNPAQSMRDRRGRVYTPAIGPRLRPLLWTVLIGFALLMVILAASTLHREIA